MIWMLVLTSFIYCSSPPQEFSSFLGYDLEAATKKYRLGKQLQEISGLSYVAKDKLACVDDEKGNLYIFDLKTEKLTKKLRFAKDKDFEGIEIINKQAWVLRSNGDLYKISGWNSKSPEVKHFQTFLSSTNDTEGLGFDSEKKRLLVACKGLPEDKSLNSKAIYGFDLDTKKLLKKPIYQIDLKQVQRYQTENPILRFVEKLQDFFDPGNNLSFQPSAIAVHPTTREVYILSSVGKLLIILKPGGKIKHVQKLDPTQFKQPEGIAFSPTGILYIANEGRGGKANILEFHPKHED